LGQSTPEVAYALRIPKDKSEEFQREIALIPEARRESWRRHTILDGETLEQIAAAYHVKSQEIALVNHLDGVLPSPGNRLSIPVPYRAPAPPRITATRRSTRPAGVTAPAHPGFHLVHYRVKSGDSLATIAQRYQVSIAQLQQWNRLTSTRVRAGQILTVRSSPPASTGVATAAKASTGPGDRPLSGPAVASRTAPAAKAIN
jgi:membrane-bound lytic murein transglycosylase D